MTGFLALGIAIIVMGLIAIVAPQTLVKESKRNHARRLKELEDGAPEAYFEEKRELEAYRPRFDLTHSTIRRLGIVAMFLGAAAIVLEIY